MKSKSIIEKKSFDFALEIIIAYKELVNNREYILSKQLLRSGTSVGANIREAQNAESKKDFIHKLSISQKECDETIYWLDLLNGAEFISDSSCKKLKNTAEEILKILKSIIITSKRNLIVKK